MNKEVLFEVVDKLVGSIDPVGESRHDEKAFKNLELYTDIIDYMVRRVYEVGYHKDRHEASLNRAGQYADKFIKQLREWSE